MRGFGLIVLGVFATSLPASAHHSDAGYDRDTVVAVEGTVTRFVWRNPHVMILLEAEDQTGRRIAWEIETGSTPIMARSGWSRDMLSPGDTIAVRMHPEHSGRPRAILNTLTTADGNLYTQVEEESEETVAATGLAGVWRGTRDSSLFRQMPDMALTAAAEAARAAYDGTATDPARECEPNPTPFSISSVLYLTGIELLQDRAILRNELLDATRTVYMDGREHPENGEYTLMGHSIGWWEDDVLVVDTRLFEEHPRGNGWTGVPSSREKHVVERYSLSEDRRRAEVDIFVEDPVYLAEPFSARIEMIYTPHLELFRYNCVPGSVE